MDKFTKAWDKINLCPIDVNDLPKSRNGLDCHCACVECHMDLEACQGEKRSWYFRHANQTDCKGGPMTALHLMAQFLLLGNKTIRTKTGEETYWNGVAEFILPKSRYKADVAGDKNEFQKIVIEIRVTRTVEEGKLRFLKDQKIHSIEINLSEVKPDIATSELLKLLLEDFSKQNIIYSPHQEDNKVSVPFRFEWLVAVIIFAVLICKCIRKYIRVRKC
jgi:hypothetical protein